MGWETTGIKRRILFSIVKLYCVSNTENFYDKKILITTRSGSCLAHGGRKLDFTFKEFELI